MGMEYVNVGKIVNTFGIKGELKIVSRFEMADKVFKIHNKIMIMLVLLNFLKSILGYLS